MHKIGRPGVYIFFLIALLLQVTLLDYLKIGSAKLDLILILVVFVGIFAGAGRGFEAGFAAGFFEDVFTFEPFWTNAFILGITGFVAGILGTKFFSSSRKTHGALVFFLAVFSMSLHFLVSDALFNSIRINYRECLFTAVIPGAIYTSILSIPVFGALVNFFGLKEEDDFL